MKFEERYLTSFDLSGHPMSASNIPRQDRESYFITLRYLAMNTDDALYVREQVKKYQQIFDCTGDVLEIDHWRDANLKVALKVLIDCGYILWVEVFLVLDLVKIMMQRSKVQTAISFLKEYIPETEYVRIQKILEDILTGNVLDIKYSWVQQSIKEIEKNWEELNKRVYKILVTATMSAGKSTLINCLIGKNVLPACQERCTANLLYIYEREQEEDNILLVNENGSKQVKDNLINEVDWSSPTDILCDIPENEHSSYRLCFIDTPGVNSAIEETHGVITRKATIEEEYDILLCILDKPETDEEISHLKWLAENVDKEKIIFILNKLDKYKAAEDDISKRICDVKEELEQLGFVHAVLCPVSAYFGLLLKKKQFHQQMTEDEQDEFALLVKKYKKEPYNLSGYYPYHIRYISGKNMIKKLSSNCGIYELEKIINRRLGMKKVFIKYNPYKLETEITVNGKEPAENSRLRDYTFPGTRLQEWVEGLPQILVDEFNDNDFDITFHGTMMDYEDLVEVCKQAYKTGIMTVKLEHIPAKETADKEILINEVFQKIQQGCFEELKTPDIIDAFQKAKSGDFDVCVVATMSAGKSTLINAMLGTKLLPSKQEACTAIITKIKDTDSTGWRADVYDKDGHRKESYENLDYSIMSRLNDDENVSEIKVHGNIPFVQADDMALVLIDTPGPNNARNEEHRKVQESYLDSSSKTLVLYIMEGTFGSSDDDTLLEKVAKSMSVGGKQSKDRFIFVVNKMDDRKKEDGEISATLGRVREYLENHGIYNPNIFPAAALPALNIRMINSGAQVDEDTLDETEVKVRKLNRSESFHFENYSPLPSSLKNDKIGRMLDEACKNNDVNTQALIHTGVVSIETAIRQYVNKYAKTAKIKNIADTFIHKLDDVECFEKTKKELAKNLEEGERIAAQIERVREKVDDLNGAKQFADAVDVAVKDVNEKSNSIVTKIIKQFQGEITYKIDEYRGKDVLLDKIQDVVDDLKRFTISLEQQFKGDLDRLIRKNLVDTSDRLLEEYRKKLNSLTEEINIGPANEIKIEPLKLMNSLIRNTAYVHADDYTYAKEEEDGEEWVENTDKKWYKPWTWFQEAGYYRKKYKTVQYVQTDELAQNFFQPIKDGVYENGENAKKYALKQSKYISEKFNEEFKKLDEILKNKLEDLQKYATDKNNAEEKIRNSEKKLEWLNEIKADIDSILEI